MIAALIAGVFVIALICAAGNGEWGAVAVCVVIILAVLFLKSADMSVSRAHNNFVDYWEREK